MKPEVTDSHADRHQAEVQGKKGCGERAITRSKLGRPFLARREAPRPPLSAMWDGELHRDTLPIS